MSIEDTRRRREEKQAQQQAQQPQQAQIDIETIREAIRAELQPIRDALTIIIERQEYNRRELECIRTGVELLAQAVQASATEDQPPQEKPQRRALSLDIQPESAESWGDTQEDQEDQEQPPEIEAQAQDIEEGDGSEYIPRSESPLARLRAERGPDFLEIGGGQRARKGQQ
jgi:hypothetical protein